MLVKATERRRRGAPHRRRRRAGGSGETQTADGESATASDQARKTADGSPLVGGGADHVVQGVETTGDRPRRGSRAEVGEQQQGGALAAWQQDCGRSAVGSEGVARPSGRPAMGSRMPETTMEAALRVTAKVAVAGARGGRGAAVKGTGEAAFGREAASAERGGTLGGRWVFASRRGEPALGCAVEGGTAVAGSGAAGSGGLEACRVARPSGRSVVHSRMLEKMG